MEIGMNAIVTVIGKDKVGISQTILDGKFTMVMAVDAANANVGFEELAAQLRELGEGMELSIRIQREEIFDAMHRI